jgi:hypothetical protein
MKRQYKEEYNWLCTIRTLHLNDDVAVQEISVCDSRIQVFHPYVPPTSLSHPYRYVRQAVIPLLHISDVAKPRSVLLLSPSRPTAMFWSCNYS